jgi:23S rRNA (cytosine1962-C5)-methyltransferase
MNEDYELLDSGNGLKLEKFGPYTLVRPCQQALWPPRQANWDRLSDCEFSRAGGNRWQMKKSVPKEWMVAFAGLRLKASPTDFGHIGIFPEHYQQFEWMKESIPSVQEFKFLNLFAYSGAATLYMAKHHAAVCHVDASKKSVDWARENALQSKLQDRPIRWIVDDAMKFLKREAQRRSFYHGVLLDPPSFGRGSQGQVFKIEEELVPLLGLVKNVLAPNAQFVVLTNHTPGLTGVVLKNCLEAVQFGVGDIDCGEMIIPSKSGWPLPSGSYARWKKGG